MGGFVNTLENANKNEVEGDFNEVYDSNENKIKGSGNLVTNRPPSPP